MSTFRYVFFLSVPRRSPWAVINIDHVVNKKLFSWFVSSLDISLVLTGRRFAISSIWRNLGQTHNLCYIAAYPKKHPEFTTHCVLVDKDDFIITSSGEMSYRIAGSLTTNADNCPESRRLLFLGDNNGVMQYAQLLIKERLYLTMAQLQQHPQRTEFVSQLTLEKQNTIKKQINEQ